MGQSRYLLERTSGGGIETELRSELKEQSKGKVRDIKKFGNDIGKSRFILCRAPPYASPRVLARVNIREDV